MTRPILSSVIPSSGGGGGAAVQFIYAFAGAAATETDATQKYVVGEFYFDPTEATLGTDDNSVATLEVLVSTSNASNPVYCDVLQQTGVGSPVVVGAALPCDSTTSTLVTADVSTAFNTSGVPGIYSIRIWLTVNNGNDYASCTMARIKLTP